MCCSGLLYPDIIYASLLEPGRNSHFGRWTALLTEPLYHAGRKMESRKKERRIRKLFLPILRSLSAVCLAGNGFSGDRVHFTPGSPLCSIAFALFLFGKLFVGYKFFHDLTSCRSYIDHSNFSSKRNKRFVNNRIHNTTKKTRRVFAIRVPAHVRSCVFGYVMLNYK